MISEPVPARRCGGFPDTGRGVPTDTHGPCSPWGWDGNRPVAASPCDPARDRPLSPAAPSAPSGHRPENNSAQRPAVKGGQARKEKTKAAAARRHRLSLRGRRLSAERLHRGGSAAPQPPLPGRGGELPCRERSQKPPGERGSAWPYLLSCAAGVVLGMSRGAAAASGGRVEVPGVVLVHGPRSARGIRVPAFPHRHPPLPRRLPAPFSLPASSALGFCLPTLSAERQEEKKALEGGDGEKKSEKFGFFFF